MNKNNSRSSFLKTSMFLFILLIVSIIFGQFQFVTISTRQYNLTEKIKRFNKHIENRKRTLNNFYTTWKHQTSRIQINYYLNKHNLTLKEISPFKIIVTKNE